MNSEANTHRFTYLGLFAITFATLMFENLLTRIFSVTMWYHFAFMAVSIALFGMTVGATIVYLFPAWFTSEKIREKLASSALLFSASIIISFLIYINLPVTGSGEINLPILFVIYSLVSIPFIFSGINTCLMLTKFPGQVSNLYAADLAGAALGCIAYVFVLKITDGPTAIFVTSLVASLGALFYSMSNNGQLRLKRVVSVFTLLLTTFVCFQMVLVSQQASLVRLKWVKGMLEPTPLFEKWNTFSRIRVLGDPNASLSPFGWGISDNYPEDRKTQYLLLDIDSTAGTAISAFDGNLEKVDYLTYDITNLAHHIRSNADVLVVGTGGGRDLLSALAFKQHSVKGIEINENIINAVNGTFGDFSGHLDKIPGVVFVNDEARSYVARSNESYDIIQVSLIDTWAATASGAFVLTENSLYTLEAWDMFFDHLKPQGVLSFSRWYFKDMPGEVYRLTALASKALEKKGVKNPREHIIIVSQITKIDGVDVPDGVGTLLVSKEPFSATDIETIEAVANKLSFTLVLTPNYSIDSNFELIASGEKTDNFITNFPLNIAPPTDDNPFFFHMLRLQDIFNAQSYNQGEMNFNVKAVSVLGSLLLTVFLLTLLFIVVPLLFTTKRLATEKTQAAIPLSIFFSCLGLGFMMIEISQLQRLTVFLGHPTYGLSVVLFSLLLSSGIGSYFTQKVETNIVYSTGVRIFILLLVIGLFGLVTPIVIRTFAGAITIIRILLSILVLFPMGFLMGMAFPLGMKIASNLANPLSAWFWGINGAMSVLSSVLTIVISINSGISTSFWAGFGCYVMAFLAILWIKISSERKLSLKHQP